MEDTAYNRNEPDALTIAYIAIGAARALDASGGLSSGLSNKFEGELGFIGDIIEGALMLDRLADNAGEDMAAVFAYDVAEEYGACVARALLDGTEPDREQLAAQLVRDACA